MIKSSGDGGLLRGIQVFFPCCLVSFEGSGDHYSAAWSLARHLCLVRHLCDMMWGWLSLQIFGWKFVSCPFLSYKLESGGRLAAWSLVRHLCETRWEWLSLPLELSETFV